MRELIELIDQQRSGWLIVQQWLEGDVSNYEVLSRNSTFAKSKLHQLQVATLSPPSAVLYETGGILVDNGWWRVLGSGHPRLPRTIVSETQSGHIKQFWLLMMYPEGFFALNDGEFGKDRRGVSYFTSDSLEWERLDTNHSGFLQWALYDNLNRFYLKICWTRWQEETSSLKGGIIYSFYPPLWTEPQLSIAQGSRATVPGGVHWSFCLHLQHQLTEMQNDGYSDTAYEHKAMTRFH